ncbi:Aminopeptidase I zinc metalloprotease (M18) family protein [Aspergillus niger]|uniref:Aminopeptidase I zinc metalloprotease (M18) family protein n=1 Tax=Aspergillus niger TaxID=5061 RepID=A0A505ICI9_ASPNG|nr:Aminopeptidase I zinc metalloprotease (M18) family protein [Aspergillus niger]
MATSQPAAPPGRQSRGFSFGAKSDRSQRSSNSSKRPQISETSDEKHRRQLHSKADPMVAMSEAQPNLVALEQSTLGSLRTMQHKDQYGNIITDPDLSNPTRPRFERPLETIRSFEAAIYGTYSSRPASYVRTESTPATPGPEHSRRGSYFGAQNGHAQRGHYDQGGHYNGRGAYSRPDSYVENGNGQSDNYYPYNQGGGRPRPRHHARMNTDQKSYGFQGFGAGPNLNGQAGAGGRINFGSKPPAADPNAGGPVGGGAAAAATANRRHLRKATNDSEMSNDSKKKGWFKRRFSKN